MLIFGREMRLPIDTPLSEEPSYHPIFLKNQGEILKGAKDRVENNLEARLRYQKLRVHMNVVPRSTKNTNGETENYLCSVN